MRKQMFPFLAIITLVVAIALPQVQAQEKQKPNQLLLTNVNVWDGTSDTLIKVDVLVEGNKIKRIGKIVHPTLSKSMARAAR